MGNLCFLDCVDHWNENPELPRSGLLSKAFMRDLFWLTLIRAKESPNSLCYGSSHQNKPYSQLSQILTIHVPDTMYNDAKSACWWKSSAKDSRLHFKPGSTFQTNGRAISTGLFSVKTLCTSSEKKHFRILMENNKNQQVTLPREKNGYSSPEVLEREELNHQLHSH